VQHIFFQLKITAGADRAKTMISSPLKRKSRNADAIKLRRQNIKLKGICQPCKNALLAVLDVKKESSRASTFAHASTPG
jgi:hypothetical protein